MIAKSETCPNCGAAEVKSLFENQALYACGTDIREFPNNITLVQGTAKCAETKGFDPGTYSFSTSSLLENVHASVGLIR